MKYYLFFACVAILGITPSCRDKEFVISRTKSFQPISVFLPRAVLEHIYVTNSDCAKAATDYHEKYYSGVLVPIAEQPLTYSFLDGHNTGNYKDKIEVRFTVGKASQEFYYFGVKQRTANPTSETDRQDINLAITELSKLGATLSYGPKLDSTAINGKKAWRAVMHTDKPIILVSTTPLGFLASKEILENTFGIVINPPYP